jgi:hypothetical protein
MSTDASRSSIDRQFRNPNIVKIKKRRTLRLFVVNYERREKGKINHSHGLSKMCLSNIARDFLSVLGFRKHCLKSHREEF